MNMNLRTSACIAAFALVALAVIPTASAVGCPVGNQACVYQSAYSTGDGDCDDASAGHAINSIMVTASPDRTVGGYAVVGTECDDNSDYEWNSLSATASAGSPAGGGSASARWNYYDPHDAQYCNSYVKVNADRTDVPLCTVAGGPPEVPLLPLLP